MLKIILRLRNIKLSMRLNKLTGLVLLCLAFFSSGLVAQDFSAQNSKYTPAIYGDKFTYEEDKFYYFDELEGVLFLKGSIEQGMYKDFRQAISDNKIHTLVLESPGGIVLEGVLIAETVFDRKIKTYIRKNQNCASACAFIFLSGETRYSLGELGVHQISYGDAFSKTKEEVGKIAEAVQTANSAIVQVLEENNTPGFVYKYMFRKTADEMYYFNDDELNQLGNSDVSPQDKLFFNRIDNFSKDYNSHLIKQKCDTNPNSCTSAQLCSRAAKDNMWRTSLDAAKFVKLAKSKGNRCGVPDPVCPEDIKKCNEEYLCTYGTTSMDTGLSWLNNTFAAEAKSRGLSCGVKKTKVPYACNKDPKKCNVGPLCDFATDNTYSGPIWKKSMYWEKHVTEAKNRGLSCGVKKTNVVTKKATCSDEPKNCTIALLCQITTRRNYNADGKVWNKNPFWKKHVAEAKSRGLSCGVDVKYMPKNQECYNSPNACTNSELCVFASFSFENSILWMADHLDEKDKEFLRYVSFKNEAKRRSLSCSIGKVIQKQKNEVIEVIQTNLNRLNCNAGVSDGALGRKTLSALQRWKSAGGNYIPNKIDHDLAIDLLNSQHKCSPAQTSSTTQAKPGLLSGTWDVTYSRCDNKRYKSILSLYSSKSNEYEAIYNVQNRIYKGKLNIAGDKYSIALKGPGGLVSGNGILNKTFTRAQGRDHMGCLFDATKR